MSRTRLPGYSHTQNFPELERHVAHDIGSDKLTRLLALRVQSFFQPYHDAIEDRLGRFATHGEVPAPGPGDARR